MTLLYDLLAGLFIIGQKQKEDIMIEESNKNISEYFVTNVEPMLKNLIQYVWNVELIYQISLFGNKKIRNIVWMRFIKDILCKLFSFDFNDLSEELLVRIH